MKSMRDTLSRLGKVLAPAVWPTPVRAGWDAADPHDPLRSALAKVVEARSGQVVATRDQAMRNSVVNRARDIVCGTLGCLPFTRERGGENLGPGWLARPDPFHSRPWFVSWITDDLFFRGVAFARVTVRDSDGQVQALEWMPWTEVLAHQDDDAVTWWRSGSWWPGGGRTARLDPIEVPRKDLVVFEPSIVGVLNGGADVLTTAARLDGAADRFAGNELAAGWIKQTGGEPMSEGEALDLIARFQASRRVNTIAFVNEVADYHESSMDPSRLQLVEGRAYQDAAVARVCNVPNFAVGVGVPNDSMTYKTALTARLDLLDFGLQPFVTCWQETLTALAPRGTTVRVDVEPFLRTPLLSTTQTAEQAATERTPAR